MKPVPILSEEQQLKIVEAIVKAEECTSGEIRVHVEPKCKTDPVARAVKVFDRLEMYDTAARNGVLIYLAYETRVCAIIGDVAINEVIPEGFWSGILADMQSAFAAGSFTEGIIAAVEAVGPVGAFSLAERRRERAARRDFGTDRGRGRRRRRGGGIR